MTLWNVHDLSVSFHGHVAVSSCSFTVEAGEFIAVLGANGSGKSTLLRASLGIIPRSHGHVELFDQSLSDFHEWHRIGYVPQRINLDSTIPATVEEIVMSGRLAHRRLFKKTTKHDHIAVHNAIERVDLTTRSQSPISELSGGQYQRALIARALATEPDLLILDESTVGIDDHQLINLKGVFEQLMVAGTSIVFITHELGVFESLTKRAIVLDHGRIVHDGEVMANQGRI